MNNSYAIGLVIAGGCAIAGVWGLTHRIAGTPGSPTVKVTDTDAPAHSGVSPSPMNTPDSISAAEPLQPRSTVPPPLIRPMPVAARGFTPSSSSGKPAKRPKAVVAGASGGPLVDATEPPIARAALSLVGVDPDAEALWSASINDPSVPAEARKNLIEDLNEDGFPDPHHVTTDDLPLILSRMQMIEQFAPDAMDEVNAAAFEEAYKDLTEMLAKAAGT